MAADLSLPVSDPDNVLQPGGPVEVGMRRATTLSVPGGDLRDGPLRAIPIASGFENRGDAGTIGGELLRRFALTPDYPSSLILLEPNAACAEPAREDLSGLWPAGDGEAHWKSRSC
jgi:hypothetical protein